MAKAVGTLVTYLVYNHDRDPIVPTFLSNVNFKDMLYQELDEDGELHKLLQEDNDDKAFMVCTESHHHASCMLVCIPVHACVLTNNVPHVVSVMHTLCAGSTSVPCHIFLHT